MHNQFQISKWINLTIILNYILLKLTIYLYAYSNFYIKLEIHMLVGKTVILD